MLDNEYCGSKTSKTSNSNSNKNETETYHLSMYPPSLSTTFWSLERNERHVLRM